MTPVTPIRQPPIETLRNALQVCLLYEDEKNIAASDAQKQLPRLRALIATVIAQLSEPHADTIQQMHKALVYFYGMGYDEAKGQAWWTNAKHGIGHAQYVVWSFEHRAWWGPYHSGYTDHLGNAGRYDASEAGRIVTNSVLGEEVAILEQVAALNGAPTVESLWHQCDLPESIKHVLNSGDGTYRP